MNRARIGVVALAVTMAPGVAGCRGEEVARVALTAPGQTNQASWTTTGSAKVQVWVDYSGEWKGSKDDPGLVYDVEVLEGATSVQKIQCATSTCNTRVCGSTVSINNSHSGNCECKTSCNLEVGKAGTFTVKATVQNPTGSYTSSKDASLVLRKP
jgi:hypothetical protein